MVRAHLMETLETALQSLTKEEQELIWKIFYLDQSEREVAAACNLTQAAIHKRKKKALEKLRKFFE